MLIGELATASGLTREAPRFYEQQGLIRAQRLATRLALACPLMPQSTA